MTIRCRWFALPIILVGAACARHPSDPAPAAQEALADSLVLAPGDTALVGALRLTFLDVTGDSRCPIDAVCVWQGNAAVRISVGLGNGVHSPAALNTSEPEGTVDFAGYRVRLLRLSPAPRAATPTPPGDYRATFRVETRSDAT